MSVASVVIPAHNEAATIERNLAYLFQDVWPLKLDVLVVCNGCTDETASRAREAVAGIRVLEIEDPSKAVAVRVGNEASGCFPRVHVDADVVLSGADLRRLIQPLQDGGVLAAAPRRVLVTARSSLAVRWYYDVWERLPRACDGLSGRGVVALSEEGQARVDAFCEVMGDEDLAMSEAFAPSERVLVQDAEVRVAAPRRFGDLVRRGVRAAAGDVRVTRATARLQRSSFWRELCGAVVHHPTLIVKVPVFVAVSAVIGVLARRAIRRG